MSGEPEITLAELAPEAVSAYLAPFIARAEGMARQSAGRTPLYLFDPAALDRRHSRFRAAFRRFLPQGVNIFFAVKCNPHRLLLRRLVELGAGLDVSSGRELELGLAAGCGRMLFSGPGKTDAELELAAGHWEKLTVLIDSFGELERLEAAAAKRGVVVRAGVRLTTIDDGLWRKFGIPLARLGEFWGRAGRLPHVALRGVQFHTSWNMDPSAQVAFIGRLGPALAALGSAALRDLEFVDIGGGYWPRRGEWLVQPQGPPLLNPGTAIEAFASAIAGALEEHVFPLAPCAIYAEPGRWMADEAMHLAVSVVDMKAPDVAVTDGGIHMVGWERYETDFAPLLNLSRPSARRNECLVCGSLCTPHDVWGQCYYGEGLEVGDILLVPDQGAYTYTLRQEFIKPHAATIGLAV